MIHHGDCVEGMAALEADSIDAIVTDPPYGIGFMGKEWDGAAIRAAAARDAATRRSLGPASASRPGRTEPRTSSAFGDAAHYAGPVAGGRAFQEWCEAWAREALRVLEPGGHLIAFGGTRTYHRLACAIEDAGFEIRDQIQWLYGSGFPKSRNLDGDWEGWGTALKPAHEPIAMARKPFAGTVAGNMDEHGTGAVNVAGCRIEHADAADLATSQAKNPGRDDLVTSDVYGAGRPQQRVNVEGRWPANVVLDEEAAAMLDEQSGTRARGNHPAMRSGREDEKVYGSGWSSGTNGDRRSTEAGGASRFFYCAKAGRSERNAGLEGFETKPLLWSSGEQSPGTFQAEGTERAAKNPHPTVKPIALMRWLCRLVTPPGGTVLDPFTGSGTTGCAAALEDFEFVGFEREAEYVAIAEARIAHWRAQPVQQQLGL
jgi:DNA modification methylase